VEVLKKIEAELKPPKPISLSNNDKYLVPVGMQTNERKKYKISVNNRNEQEISRLKNQILLKKRVQEGEEILMIPDSDEDRDSSEKKKNSDVIELDVDDIAMDVEPV
jgi:hypothetical protein